MAEALDLAREKKSAKQSKPVRDSNGAKARTRSTSLTYLQVRGRAQVPSPQENVRAFTTNTKRNRKNHHLVQDQSHQKVLMKGIDLYPLLRCGKSLRHI